MKLRDFIVREAVIADLSAKTRDEAITELVRSLSKHGALDESAVDEVVAALIKREQNGTTGFGKGVAVPHVKHAKVKKMAGTLGQTASGIDFNAVDHKPVHSIALLLSPDNSPQVHLQAMNCVFTFLQKDLSRKFLKQAGTREKILEVLDDADAT